MSLHRQAAMLETNTYKHPPAPIRAREVEETLFKGWLQPHWTHAAVRSRDLNRSSATPWSDPDNQEHPDDVLGSSCLLGTHGDTHPCCM